MENRETLSALTRVAVVLAGALQGVICYVITWYIEYAKLPSDTLWLMCVVPATVVMTTTLSLAMTSFRKPFLWLSLGMIGAAVAGTYCAVRHNYSLRSQPCLTARCTGMMQKHHSAPEGLRI